MRPLAASLPHYWEGGRAVCASLPPPCRITARGGGLYAPPCRLLAALLGVGEGFMPLLQINIVSCRESMLITVDAPS